MDITKTTTPYVKPATQVVGTITELTQGTSNGNFLDKTFPTNTPKSQLTFS